MAKKQQTHAKRNREVALRERRERKQAKKAEAAARRAAGETAPTADSGNDTAGEESPTTAASEWIR